MAAPPPLNRREKRSAKPGPKRTQPLTTPANAPETDRLAQYLQAAAHNAATFVQQQSELYRILVEIEGAYARLLSLSIPESLNTAASLTLDCYSKFCTSCLLALSGQLAETSLPVRASIEAALYAFYLEQNSDVKQDWQTRDEDQGAKKRLRSALAIRGLLDAVRQVDAPLSTRLESLYEDSITLGAHPNPLAVATGVRVTEMPDHTSVTRAVLGGSPLEVEYALRTIARTTIASIELLCYVLDGCVDVSGVRALLPRLKLRSEPRSPSV